MARQASPQVITYGVLGPFAVVRFGREVLPPRALRERSVLLYLLLHANQVVPVDQLIDAVWGERPPRCVASALQNSICHIRRELEPTACTMTSHPLETKPPGYLLRVARGQLDSARLEALLEESRWASSRGQLDEAAGLLHAAQSLWRGPALADFSYEDFARSEIARLEELRLLVVAERIDVDLALARHPLLVCELRRLVTEHPFHEHFRAQLMLALYRCGRQAEALAAYREAHDALAQELGISPSPALRELEGAILRQDSLLERPALRRASDQHAARSRQNARPTASTSGSAAV